MRDVKVKFLGAFRDGGTKHYIDGNGMEYYEDNRIGTMTPRVIYDKYPDHPDAKQIFDVNLVVN